MVTTAINTTKVQSLLQRKEGETSRITGFRNSIVAGKLLSMGILPGNRVRLIRQAPFGGVWYVQAGSLLVALRKKEVACILTT